MNQYQLIQLFYFQIHFPLYIFYRYFSTRPTPRAPPRRWPPGPADMLTVSTQNMLRLSNLQSSCSWLQPSFRFLSNFLVHARRAALVIHMNVHVNIHKYLWICMMELRYFDTKRIFKMIFRIWRDILLNIQQ